MWILAIHDRVYWLLSGKKYIIGRTSKFDNSDVDFPVSGDTSVSRKHATLEVRNVSDDAILHPSIRSELIITDMESRFGTIVDGSPLSSGASCSVPQTPNGMVNLKLGGGTKLRLKWQSYVVTYSTGQTGEAHDTLWQHAVNVLKPLDVKIMPHIVNSTNIVVKTGKTTSSIYYALTRQIPVANTQYFEALKAAAHETSIHGTSGSSVIPDPTSYYPDPSWAPNPKRAQCFKDKKFHLPVFEHAAALEPILTSAGAKVIGDQADAISIYPAWYDSDKIPNEVQFAIDISVFTAILECRTLNASEIHVKKDSTKTNSSLVESPRKRSRNKAKILDIMTSQDPSSREGGELEYEPRSKRQRKEYSITKRDIKGVDTLTNQSSFPDKEPKSAVRVQHENMIDQTGKIPSKAPVKQPTRGIINELSAKEPNVTKNTRKRTIRTATDDRPSKRIARSEDDTDTVFSTNTDEAANNEDIVVVDYNAIGELSIVENILEVPNMSGSYQPDKDSNARYADRRNYKAFKKSTNNGKSVPSKKIDYDEPIVNEKYDYEDFDMLDDGASKAPHVSTNYTTMAQLASQSKNYKESRTDEEKSDEDLFVGSDNDSIISSEGSDLSRSKQSPRGRGIIGGLNQNTNAGEDEFGFSFG